MKFQPSVLFAFAEDKVVGLGEDAHSCIVSRCQILDQMFCFQFTSKNARANPFGVTDLSAARSFDGESRFILLPSIGLTRLISGITNPFPVHKHVFLVYASPCGSKYPP